MSDIASANQVQVGDFLAMMSSLPDSSIDLVLTDPPFGINYQNNYTRNQHDVLAGDERPFSYAEFGKEAFRVLKPNTALFVFTGWSEYPKHFAELSEAGFAMKEPIICQKRPSGKTDLYGSFQSNADWIMFGHKGRFTFKPTTLVRNKRAGTIPNVGRKPVAAFKTRMPSCWFGDEYPWSTENSSFQRINNLNHPTIKSQLFAEWLIQLASSPGDTVLDPFVGSGTTAVAAQATGRLFIASDISPTFVAMANRRLSLLG